MTRPIAAGLVAVLLCSITAIAQGDQWYGRSLRPKDFVPAVMPWNTLALELPKDWQLVPGRGAILFTVTEKTKTNRPGGAIIIEQKKLPFALSPEQVNAELADLEAKDVASSDPVSTPVGHELMERDGRRIVFVRYTRPGFAGQDTVVTYNFVHGDVMFRVVGVAPTAQLSRYQPIFAHVAATFRDTGLLTP